MRGRKAVNDDEVSSTTIRRSSRRKRADERAERSIEPSFCVRTPSSHRARGSRHAMSGFRAKAWSNLRWGTGIY